MDNGKLKKLFNDHYSEKNSSTSINQAELTRLRENRYKILKRIVKNKELKTGTDYFKAALLYQDSGSIKGVLKARRLANKGVKIGGNRTKWLSLTSRYGGTQNSIRGHYQKKYGKVGTNFSQGTSSVISKKNSSSHIRRSLKF